MNFVTVVMDWAKARWAERSTWDGAALVGISVLALIASPIIKYAAWAGIAYGAYRIYQDENKVQ